MNKNLKTLIKNTTEIFSADLLNNIGKKQDLS